MGLSDSLCINNLRINDQPPYTDLKTRTVSLVLSMQPIEGNAELLKTFVKSLDGVSDVTKYEYETKLKQMQHLFKFDLEDETPMLEYVQGLTNPNTRSNKAFVLIRLRRHFNKPVEKLEEFREENKKDIVTHRKKHAKLNNEALVTYKQLLDKLDELEGRDYYMNYMYAHHGLRNRDINVRYRPSLSKATKNENIISFNPKGKTPKVTLYIVDYKTSETYGAKTIVIKNKRLFDELVSLDLKNGEYIFKTAAGKQATINYMNVRASKHSINNYGEGKIAKILLKHLLDTNQYGRVQALSEQRGTSLKTLYTTYNVMDN